MKDDMTPKFNLQDIQISVGDKEFNKGLELYKNNSVKNITGSFKGYTTTIVGTSKYSVVIDSNSFDRDNRNCFLGQKETSLLLLQAFFLGQWKISKQNSLMY